MNRQGLLLETRKIFQSISSYFYTFRPWCSQTPPGHYPGATCIYNATTPLTVLLLCSECRVRIGYNETKRNTLIKSVSCGRFAKATTVLRFKVL